VKRGIDEHLYRRNRYTKAVMQITTKGDERRYNPSATAVIPGKRGLRGVPRD
jgi:hypothetical protein